MYGYIYRVTNLVNKKFYIGQKTSDVFLAEKYLGSGKNIKAAVKKYGKENFSVEMIDTAETLDELNEKEVFWIKKLDAQNQKIAYNLAYGGQTPSHIQTEEEREKRSNSLKKAYREKRHRVIRNAGIKLRKRTPEENKANSERQQNKIWIKNPNLNIQTTLFDTDNLDQYLSSGWEVGRFKNSKDAWNKGKTKETNESLKNISDRRNELFKEKKVIGCYGLSGEKNINFKSDEFLKENIINKGLEYIWQTYGRETATKFFHISYKMLDRCLSLINLEESKEHRCQIKKNKKGKTEEQIQLELTQMFDFNQ